MRFFTRDWCDSKHDEAETKYRLRQYRDHVVRITRCLPATVRRLVNDVNVHDGLFRQVVLHPRDRRLTIKLRCGDLQVGYYDADMVFEDVVLLPPDRRRLRRVANRKKTEVLYDEVDVATDGEFEYRFICWPDGEVRVRFRRFSYRKKRVSRRESAAANPRFRVLK